MAKYAGCQKKSQNFGAYNLQNEFFQTQKRAGGRGWGRKCIN